MQLLKSDGDREPSIRRRFGTYTRNRILVYDLADCYGMDVQIFTKFTPLKLLKQANTAKGKHKKNEIIVDSQY